jgi:hypothetical protein
VERPGHPLPPLTSCPSLSTSPRPFQAGLHQELQLDPANEKNKVAIVKALLAKRRLGTFREVGPGQAQQPVTQHDVDALTAGITHAMMEVNTYALRRLKPGAAFNAKEFGTHLSSLEASGQLGKGMLENRNRSTATAAADAAISGTA